MCKVIAIANQKGGVSKTTSALNLGVALAMKGHSVMLIDADPQSNLTTSLGYVPYDLEYTLADIMNKYKDNEEDGLSPDLGILYSKEEVDLMPASIRLADLQLSLVGALCSEQVLKWYVDSIRDNYEFIIVDSEPSLSILSTNVLVCADSIIIPVPTEYLPTEGLVQLISRINEIRKKRANPKLQVEGILFTRVNARTNDARSIMEQVREAYGRSFHVYENFIPESVKVKEAASMGVSIFRHDPHGKVAEGYMALAEEVIANA